MPRKFCQPCQRWFYSDEAMKQHLSSSETEHPFCDRSNCLKRFASESARDAHVKDKHPPTFPCAICGTEFSQPSHLADHYRGSAKHPNCLKCGRGFLDRNDLQEHYDAVHVPTPCRPCGGILVDKDKLPVHYLTATAHPKCGICNLGFQGEEDYQEHRTSLHPKCIDCDLILESTEALHLHYYDSDNHPQCFKCEIGFVDHADYGEHLLVIHPVPPSAIETQLVDIMNTPSPRNAQELPDISPASSPTSKGTPNKRELPPPSPMISRVWGQSLDERMDDPRDRATAPILDIDNPWNRGSPDLDVQLLVLESEKTLSIENDVTAAGGPSLEANIGRHNGTNTSSSIILTPSAPVGDERRVSPHRSTSHLPEWRSRTTSPSSTLGEFSSAQAARRRSTAIKYGMLYSRNSPTESSFGLRTSPAASTSRLGPFSPNNGANAFTSRPDSPPLAPLVTPGHMQRNIDWRQLMNGSPVARSQSRRSDDVSSTQAVITPQSLTFDPFRDVDDAAPNKASKRPSWGSSPSSASPTSNTYLKVPLPSSPCHSRSPSHPTSIKFTSVGSPTGSSLLSYSPEVHSPVGLAPLPDISPLITTPVNAPFSNIPDPRDYYPGTPQLAANSRLPSSPSVALLTSAVALTDPSTSQGLQVDILALPLPDSPTVSELASPSHGALGMGVSPLLAPAVDRGRVWASHEYRCHTGAAHDLTIILEEHGVATPAAKVAQSGDQATSLDHDHVGHDSIKHDEYDADASTNADEDVSMPNAPVHVNCRMCYSNPCVEPTVTLCGHLFCYHCISEHILQDQHCPVCSRAMMLNCLVTLHLSD